MKKEQVPWLAPSFARCLKPKKPKLLLLHSDAAPLLVLQSFLHSALLMQTCPAWGPWQVLDKHKMALVLSWARFTCTSTNCWAGYKQRNTCCQYLSWLAGRCRVLAKEGKTAPRSLFTLTLSCSVVCAQRRRGGPGGLLSVWWPGDRGRRRFRAGSVHPALQMPEHRWLTDCPIGKGEFFS